MLFVGVDLGTSAVKLLLMDENGKIKNIVSKEYPLYFPHPGWSEQKPEDWFSQSMEGLKELLEGFDKDQVKGISFGGQMHGLVALDKEDKVIRPAILWNDGRTAKQTDYLNQVIGKEKLSEYTANIAFAGFTAPKILWMKENEPENFAKIEKIMLPKDYLAYRLSGAFCTEYSDASGMLLLDVEHKCWSAKMLEICGITEAQLPKLYESWEVVGTLKAEIAAELGVSEDVKVIAGAGDNAAAAVGTATVGDGGCNISLGTSGTLFISGENHVFYLPYLMGERSPHNDPSARAAFIGMSMDSTREDMTQAVLEGVAFGLRDSLEVARSIGVNPERTKICGGGAKSPLWRKIIANVMNMKVDLIESEEGPGYGAAILAAVGCGVFDSVEEAAKKLVKVTGTEEPDPELVQKYEERYQEFKKLYPALKGFFQE